MEMRKRDGRTVEIEMREEGEWGIAQVGGWKLGC